MVTITPGKDHMHLSLGLTDEQNLILLGIAIKALKIPTIVQIEENDIEALRSATLDEAAKESTESLEKHGLNTNNGLFMMGFSLAKIAVVMRENPIGAVQEMDEIRKEITEKGIEI